MAQSPTMPHRCFGDLAFRYPHRMPSKVSTDRGRASINLWEYNKDILSPFQQKRKNIFCGAVTQPKITLIMHFCLIALLRINSYNF